MSSGFPLLLDLTSSSTAHAHTHTHTQLIDTPPNGTDQFTLKKNNFEVEEEEQEKTISKKQYISDIEL